MAIRYAYAHEWVLQLDMRQENDTEPDWMSLLEGFTTLGESRSDTTTEYNYLSGFGAQETGVDGTSREFSVTGDRVYGDPLHEEMFSFDTQWTISKRQKGYRYFNIVTGEGEQGNVTLAFSTTAGGANGERATFGVTISVNGSPAKYNHGIGPWTVSYDASDGNGTVTDSTKYNGGEKAIVQSALDITPPSGKEFLNWNTRKDGTGISYLPGELFGVVDNITLYAIWGD